MEFNFCSRFIYSNHVLLQMAERRITATEVELVVGQAEVITVYQDEKPFPCFLLMGWVNSLALHVVIAQNQVDTSCVVVTTYRPNPDKWSADFKTRLKR